MSQFYRRSFLIFAILPIMAIALWWGAGWAMGYSAKRALTMVQQSLPTAQSLHYGAVQVDVFAHRVTLENVVISAAGIVQPLVQADKITISGIPWLSPRSLTFDDVVLENIIARLGRQYQADRIVLRGMSWHAADTIGGAAEPWQKLVQFEALQAEAIQIKALDNKLQASVAHVAAEGADMAGQIKLLTVDGIAITLMPHDSIAQHLSIGALNGENIVPSAFFAQNGQFNFLTPFVYQMAQKLSMKDIAFSQNGQPQLSLEQWGIEGGGDPQSGVRVAVSSDVTAGKIYFSALTEPWQKQLQTLGYSDPLAFDGGVHASYNPTEHVLDIDKLIFALQQGVTIGMQAKLGNIDPMSLNTMNFENARQFAEQLLPSLWLHKANILVTEHGFVRRLIGAEAASAGMPPQVYAQQIVDNFSARASVTESGARLGELKRAVAQFIIVPESIKVSMAPDSPIPMVAFISFLMSPDKAAELVKLSATNHP